MIKVEVCKDEYSHIDIFFQGNYVINKYGAVTLVVDPKPGKQDFKACIINSAVPSQCNASIFEPSKTGFYQFTGSIKVSNQF